jgi:hypothetical protein
MTAWTVISDLRVAHANADVDAAEPVPVPVLTRSDFAKTPQNVSALHAATPLSSAPP